MKPVYVTLATLVWFVVVGLPHAAHAQQAAAPVDDERDGVGLSLDGLLSDQGLFRIETGATFGTFRRTGVSSATETIVTGTGEFVPVASTVGTTDRRTDTLIGTFGLRYGLTDDIEPYARANVSYARTQASDAGSGIETMSSSRFQSIVAGLNFRLSEEGTWPGVVAFGELTVAEHVGSREGQYVYARSGTVGLTAYRIIDPLVLSMTTGYRPSFSRVADGVRIDPGDVFFIAPNIGFAVNNEVSLSGGFQLSYYTPDKVDGVENGDTLSGELTLGLAYAWDELTTIRVDTRTEVISDRSFTVGINVTRIIGKQRSP